MNDLGYKFQIDLEAGCIFIRHYGVINLERVMERVALVRKHPDFKPDIQRVIDTTDCEIDISADEIRSFWGNIGQDIDKRGRYKEAIIVNSPLAHGMVRIYESLLPFGQIEVQVFNSDNPEIWAGIRAWLGLPMNVRFPEFMKHERMSTPARKYPE